MRAQSDARLSLWADLVYTVNADDKDSQKAGPIKLTENSFTLY